MLFPSAAAIITELYCQDLQDFFFSPKGKLPTICVCSFLALLTLSLTTDRILVGFLKGQSQTGGLHSNRMTCLPELRESRNPHVLCFKD